MQPCYVKSMMNYNLNGEQVPSFLHNRNDRSMIRLCALLWILKIQQDDYTRRKMILEKHLENCDMNGEKLGAESDVTVQVDIC